MHFFGNISTWDSSYNYLEEYNIIPDVEERSEEQFIYPLRNYAYMTKPLSLSSCETNLDRDVLHRFFSQPTEGRRMHIGNSLMGDNSTLATQTTDALPLSSYNRNKMLEKQARNYYLTLYQIVLGSSPLLKPFFYQKLGEIKKKRRKGF